MRAAPSPPSAGVCCWESPAARRRRRRRGRPLRAAAGCRRRPRPPSSRRRGTRPREASRAAAPAGSAGSPRFSRERTNHGGNWNSTAPSLPASARGASASRCNCHTSSISRSRDVTSVDRALAAHVVRQPVPQPVGESLGGGGVVRQPGERLDVEDEAGRCARRPELAVASRRRRVVRRVDLDDVELLGVVPQPRLGAAHTGRVEAAAGDQRGVCPGAAAHQDACGHGSLRSKWLRGAETLYHPRPGPILRAKTQSAPRSLKTKASGRGS